MASRLLFSRSKTLITRTPPFFPISSQPILRYLHSLTSTTASATAASQPHQPSLLPSQRFVQVFEYWDEDREMRDKWLGEYTLRGRSVRGLENFQELVDSQEYEGGNEDFRECCNTVFGIRHYMPGNTLLPCLNLILDRILPRSFNTTAQCGPTSQLNHSTEKEICKKPSIIGDEGIVKTDAPSNVKEVMSFSSLEIVSAKSRNTVLVNESKKIKQTELSQKITFALIPALILISKSTLTTSLLVFSVYWQIYGYLKEIFLDYVHHDVTRTWVLVYLKVLLLILVKDTILAFGLV